MNEDDRQKCFTVKVVWCAIAGACIGHYLKSYAMGVAAFLVIFIFSPDSGA